MRVFDAAWFRRHQRGLLGVLNAPGLGAEVRAALGIRARDLPPRTRLTRLWPHAYAFDQGDVRVVDVRTHAKYAKALQREYRALWQLCHWFDLHIANPVVPALNLGFDTFTFVPTSALDPPGTTVDGTVWRWLVNETWAAITAGAGNDVDMGTTNPSTPDSDRWDWVFQYRSSSTTNQWNRVGRGIFLFDTSVLTPAATILSAVFSLVGQGKEDTTSESPTIDVYTVTPASNTALAPGDYNQFGSVSQTGAPVAYGSLTTDQTSYVPFVFNATGIGNINRAGISKFGTRNANFDAANVAPTWLASPPSSQGEWRAFMSEHPLDPKLVITATVPVFGFADRLTDKRAIARSPVRNKHVPGIAR